MVGPIQNARETGPTVVFGFCDDATRAAQRLACCQRETLRGTGADESRQINAEAIEIYGHSYLSIAID